ncbi:AF4/FMR2 family member 1 [Halotydeus destructor]|nr:AF4/FMR2 family member 1 [Halotydeus destructor]
MSSSQHSRQRERERIQRERQQANVPHLSNSGQSANSLFGAPIKQEHEDETTKRIKNTLGDFDQIQSLLINDHKPLIGISTREITRINGSKDRTAKIKQILSEMKQTLPPLTDLDEQETTDNDNDREETEVPKRKSKNEQNLSLSDVSDDEHSAVNRTKRLQNGTAKSVHVKRKSIEKKDRRHSKEDSSSGSSNSSSSSSDSGSGSSSSSSSESEDEDNVKKSSNTQNGPVVSELVIPKKEETPPPKPEPQPEISSWSLRAFMDTKTDRQPNSVASVTSAMTSDVLKNGDNMADVIDCVARGSVGKASLSSSSSSSSSAASSPHVSPPMSPVQKKWRKSPSPVVMSKPKPTKHNHSKHSKHSKSHHDVLESDDLDGFLRVPSKAELSQINKSKSSSSQIQKEPEVEVPLPVKSPVKKVKDYVKPEITPSKALTVNNTCKEKEELEVLDDLPKKLMVSIQLMLLRRVPGTETKSSDLKENSESSSNRHKHKDGKSKERKSKHSEELSTMSNGKRKEHSSSSSKNKVRRSDGPEITAVSNKISTPIKNASYEKAGKERREALFTPEPVKAETSSSSPFESVPPVKEEPPSPMRPASNSNSFSAQLNRNADSFSEKLSRVDRLPKPVPILPIISPSLDIGSNHPENGLIISQVSSSLLLPPYRNGPGSNGGIPTPEQGSTEGDFRDMAKKLKHSADKETDRTLQLCKYLEAVLYFILTGNAIERRTLNTPGSERACVAMYKDTLNLLRHISNLLAKSRATQQEIPTTDHKLMALSFRCQSLLHQKCSRLKARETNQNMKIISNFTEKPPAGALTATVPWSIVTAMQRQLSIFSQLNLAHDLWQQADSLIEKHPPCKAFFNTLDNECGSLSLNSTFDQLVHYVKTGIKVLK